MNAPDDGSIEVVIKPVEKDKTLKQLGALFGLWVNEEAERMGESVDAVHVKWKNMFLARIYGIEQKTVEQEMWVDQLVLLMEKEAEASSRK